MPAPNPAAGEVREIGDRRAAIAAAVAAARPGDAVVVAGKGHETGQKIGGVTLPFDDAEELAAAIAAGAITGMATGEPLANHRREAERGNPEPGPGARMIAMSLAEVAAVTGGRLHRATGTERVTGVEFDSRARSAPAGCSSRCPASASTGTPSPPPRSRPVPSRCWPRATVDAPAVLVPACDAGQPVDGQLPGRHRPRRLGAAVLAALARLAAHTSPC